jgi:hypothetical protein
MATGSWRETNAALPGVDQVNPPVRSVPNRCYNFNVWVRCGSDSIAPDCCTAGPSSNLGSAPPRRPSTERKAMRTTRVVLEE